jgi:hypothetical protein
MCTTIDVMPFNVWIPIPEMLPEMEAKWTDINKKALEIMIVKWEQHNLIPQFFGL